MKATCLSANCDTGIPNPLLNQRNRKSQVYRLTVLIRVPTSILFQFLHGCLNISRNIEILDKCHLSYKYVKQQVFAVSLSKHFTLRKYGKLAMKNSTLCNV